jgi:hypothetical protein
MFEIENSWSFCDELWRTLANFLLLKLEVGDINSKLLLKIEVCHFKTKIFQQGFLLVSAKIEEK